MEQLFRSRGVKVIVGESEPHRMKIYYEPNIEILSLNPEVLELAGRFECLEYAVAEGEIDAINFHTGCKNVEDIISEFNCELIAKMGEIFDTSYKPYTLGYRLNGGKSIYYYPTVWKDTRFGICGIIDNSVINEQINRFLFWVSASNDCRNIIYRQIPYITKFKGVCITNYQNKNSYKLYFRMTSQGICKTFVPDCDIEKYCDEYGEIVLISIGIMNGEIESYNFYFLR